MELSKVPLQKTPNGQQRTAAAARAPHRGQKTPRETDQGSAQGARVGGRDDGTGDGGRG